MSSRFATPTLRYGPAGDSAPMLRLKALVWPKGTFRPGHGPKPKPLFFLVNSHPLRIGPERSRARNAAERTLDGEDRSGIIHHEGKGESL